MNQSTVLDLPSRPSQPSRREPLFLERAHLRRPLPGDHAATCLLNAAATCGELSLFEIEAEPGGGVPPHVHQNEDETFVVLEGLFTFTVDSAAHTAGPGDTVFAPRRRQHAWQCISEAAGRAVMLATPGGFEYFLDELSRMGGARVSETPVAGTPVAGTPVGGMQIQALAACYGIEMNGATRPNALSAVVTASHEGRVLDVLGMPVRCLLTANDTGGTFSLFDVRVVPGQKVAPHVHQNEDETFYIRSGEFTFRVGDTVVTARPGDAVHAPRGIAHSFSCTGSVPGRALLITTPGGFENFLGALENVAAVGDPDTVGDPDARMARISGVYEHFGIKAIAPSG